MSIVHKGSIIVNAHRISTSSATTWSALAVVVALVATAPVRANGPVLMGDDVFSTPCGGGTYDNDPIPPGFFTSTGGAASLAYLDGIELGGVPLAINPLPGADVDTIVRRLADTPVGFTCGSLGESVPIQIQALHLESCSPIIVDYNDNTSEQWDVSVCLDSTQTSGTMTLNHECADGGTYSSNLPVQVNLRFSRVGGGVGSPLVMPTTTLFFDSTGWWTHQDGVFDIVTLAAGDQFDKQCDGAVDAVDPTSIGTSNFYPGQFLLGCAGCSLSTAGPGLGCCEPTDQFCEDQDCFDCVIAIDPGCAFAWTPNCAALANGPCMAVCPCGPPPPTKLKPKISPEWALLAAHGIVPANPSKFSGGGGGGVPTVACCKPFTSLPTRCIDVDETECVTLWGGTPVPGQNCATAQCDNDPTYENWVIADDFNISCPECQCDFDFDGLCTAVDLAFLVSCINNGGGVNCDQADLDCDGRLTGSDLAVIQCLFAGIAPDVCCPSARPKVSRVRWYGSYIDPAFEPPSNTLDVDAWLIGLHSDVPPQACLPPPPGTSPLDLCGTLTLCATSDWLFTPKGSSFSYNLADVNSLLSGANPGDMVRLCGHFDEIISSPCPIGIDTAVVDAVLPCDSKVSKPSRLLAQWGLDPTIVTIEDTGKTGGDGHKIYCYTADLPEGCLLHDYSTAGEVDDCKRICPLNDRTYWISIQAAEGHALTMNADGTCTEVATGDPAVTRDFWGWHTTPPGHQRLDDAYMGVLHMAVDPNDPMGCEHSWVYNWMSHLHCSDPRYTDCCDDPTKSIDMAFYLIDTQGRCGSTLASCKTNADCIGGDVCNLTEQVRWCQPVNPGPPTPPFPPIPPFPPGNPDEMKETVADAVISLDGLPPGEPVIGMVGPTVVKRGIEHEDIGAPVDVIDTEIIAMDLVGSSPTLGPVRITLNPDNSSTGQSIRPKGQFQIDSFFDVWVEISVGSQPSLITTAPIRVQAIHFEIPPGRIQFVGPVGGPVELVERGTGVTRGTLDQIIHYVPYNGGVNIHSDVDWPTSPMDDCCEPNQAATACEPVICPDPSQTCVPSEQSCDCVFGCTSTGSVCFSDADCPIAGDTCDAMGCVCTIIDCECRNPNPPCKSVEVAGVWPPIECVNDCEDPALECRRFGIDTDGDGIDDRWRCDCDPVIDPTGVCCDANGFCYLTTASLCPVPPNVSFHPGGACLGLAACCLPDDTCSNIDILCCQDLGGTPILGALCTGNVEACCFDDGTCEDLDPVCCTNRGGTPGAPGSACANADEDNNDVDDACDPVCEPDPNGPGCIGLCPGPVPVIEECVPRCVHIDPLTGVMDASVCDCVDLANCHVTSASIGGGVAPSVVAGPGGNPCVVMDDGSGTITLPPDGCEYLSPQDVHMILDGLPVTVPPTTIELGVAHRGFFCSACEGGTNNGKPCDSDLDCPGGMCRPAVNSTCSFNFDAGCDQAGGGLGGDEECSQSEVVMQMNGTGLLAGFNRLITMPVQFETRTGPRTPGDAVQSFPTEMMRLQGEIFGDPDFDLLRITAGTDNGLPSPGHTTLTRLGDPGSSFQVDSFFDVEYRIEFQGAPGSLLNGLFGTTAGTIHMATGGGNVKCEGDCPAGFVCNETRTVNADGTLDLCCDCVAPCGPTQDFSDCAGTCPIDGDVCAPECVVIDPATGELTVSGCDCYGDDCHVDLPNSAGGGLVSVAGPTGNPCTVIDNGSGTIELPPPGCEYLSPEEVHEIVNGLPGGATIELAAIHKDFICNKQDPACAAPPLVCEEPGGTLGGKIECFTSSLELQMNGTGVMSAFNKNVTIQATCQAHTSPTAKEQAEQTFQNEMFSLEAEIVPGDKDPDFSTLRITAGSAFGLPSPGHTTLTRLGGPGSSFAVDSFFDIEYRIDWAGAAGGPLNGMFGSNTGTLHMSTGGQPQCVGSCPAGEVCVREKTVQADGKVQVCCRCEPEVCEPTDDGLGCEDIFCPTNGEVCVPQQIKCTANGCRVTVCDCQPPNDCHIEPPPAGTNTPVCVGGCPSVNQRCVQFVKDLDGDGLAQEHFCKCVKKLPPIDIDVAVAHNRYLSIQLGGPLAARETTGRDGKLAGDTGRPKNDRLLRGGDSAAIRVKIDDAPQFPGSNGNVYWVGMPGEVCHDSDLPTPPPACSFGSFTSAELQCDTLFRDWTSVSSLSVRAPDIVPGPSRYVVQWVDSSCEDLSVEDCYSDPVFVETRKWGDVVPAFGGATQPNFADITAVVDRFKNAAIALSKPETDLGGHISNLRVNFADITLDVDAFKSFVYPFSGPCVCPSSATCPMLDACGRCTPP